MPKIKLVYILGFGHSGSTMLDLILGSMPDTESVGEIIRLRKELDWNHPCTCGERLKECSYWTPILKAYKEHLQRDSLLASLEDPYEFIKILRSSDSQAFFKRVFKGGNNNAPKDLGNSYAKRTYVLFQKIMDQSGAKTIVDSSKNHRRLILLWLSGLFEIKIVFLYRNSPELIHSLNRRTQTEFEEIMKHNKDAKLDLAYVDRLKRKLDNKASLIDVGKYIFSIKISLRNKIRSINYLKGFGFKDEDLVFINYRDIVENPNKTIDFLCSKIGIPFESDALDFQSEKYFLRGMGHNMGGNFMRKKGPRPIIASEIKRLNLLEEFLNWLFGGRSADETFEQLKKTNKNYEY